MTFKIRNRRNREPTIDKLIELHEQEIEELESKDPVHSEDRMTVVNLREGFNLIEKELKILGDTHSNEEHIFSTKRGIKEKICAAETSRNITARVIERDVSGPLHKFLEESRGFRTRQHGRQVGRQLDRQKRCQLGSTAKISPSSH
ncbi:hypothetical protein TNCV_2613791 [Trichonephila clavipes]|nr:hypothetical protein TNCV_2613791 [Trichonephila clavipes]